MSGRAVKRSRFALPVHDTPARIADILSAYDDLIENNRRRMALLEDAARQLYREWFVRLRFPGHEHTRITNGVPEGWEKGTAFAAMEVLSGGTPKTTVTDYWDGEIPFYTPKDAADTPYVVQTQRSITDLGLKNCNSRLYGPNTVFISARGTVGKLNLHIAADGDESVLLRPHWKGSRIADLSLLRAQGSHRALQTARCRGCLRCNRRGHIQADSVRCA